MNTPHQDEPAGLPLDELELTPEWVKTPDRDFSGHRGGDTERPPRREHSSRRPPGAATRGAARPPGSARPGAPGRGPRRAPDKAPAPPIPPAAVGVVFQPEEQSFAALVEVMKQSNRAYPLFDVARLVLNKPERHTVKIIRKPAAPDQPAPALVCVPATGDVFLDAEEALRFVLARRLDVVARVKKTPIEPPKGNFTFVNRCGVTGVWLGPPNYHEYQARLVRHQQQRLRHMSFEQFRARIQTVKDPEAVKAWLESMSVKTEYECALCVAPPAAADAPAEPAAVGFANREELEKHVRSTHTDALLSPAPELILAGPDSRRLEHRGISAAIRQQWEAERRFPLRTVNVIRPLLQRAGFHFFKHPNGVTFISRTKPQRLAAGQELTEHVRKIVGVLRADGKCTRKKLLDTLLPKTDAAAPHPDQELVLADLHWLLGDGYVLELADGRLWMPSEKAPPPKITVKDAAPTADDQWRPVPLGLQPSFGFGDRIGLATAGHIEAMRRAGQGIAPIFAQQSIRELARTGRSPHQVMQDARVAVRAAGWDGPTGADADHLKTTADVERMVAAGFTLFTIDPSDVVDPGADDDDAATLLAKCAADSAYSDWASVYQGRTESLVTGTTIEFTEEITRRAAVKYGRAVRLAGEIARAISQACAAAGRDYEIELSIDETPQPTTLAEHYIMADQCAKQGIKLVALAPRFIGDCEKGVDYRGNVAALEQSLRDHNAIADRLGPYKLSLHSGSDKLSIYPALARATHGRCHIKTAGTSYLEALRVVARHQPGLFRRITDWARERYDADRATYHVHATLADVPAQANVADDVELERLYLGRWADVPAGQGFTAVGRQILHCTFGSVLTHPEFGPAVRDCLKQHADTYRDVVADHFARHLAALRAGL